VRPNSGARLQGKLVRARRNENHWSLLVRSRERSAKLGCSVVTESLALKYPFQSQSQSILSLSSDGGWYCVEGSERTTVGAARRRPLEGGGVAAMLHVHWLGGRKPG
jgi:hypothetical protein